MKVCIYARVSTVDQNVEQQVENCKTWAKNNGHEVVWTIKDKESGAKDLQERERFKRIVGTINGTIDPKHRYNFLDQCDALVIQRLDRLSRNWFDENYLEKAFSVDNKLGVNLLSTSEPINFNNAEGKFIFRLQFAIACRERDVLHERTMIGVNRAKAEGKYKGRPKGSKNKVKKLDLM